MKRVVCCCLFCLALSAALAPRPVFAAASPDEVQNAVEAAVRSEAAAQGRIDAWSRERDLLLEQARTLVLEMQWLELQIKKYQRYIEVLADRVAVMEQSQGRYAVIALDLENSLLDYIKELEGLVAQGPPFLWEERQNRLRFLHVTMGDPALTVGEKCRRFFEAMSAEAEYGKKLELSSDTVLFNGRESYLTVIRAGLVGYYCITPDKKLAGVWDAASRGFLPLNTEGVEAVKVLEQMALTRQYLDIVRAPVAVAQGGL